MDKNDNQKKRVALDANLPDLPKRVIFAITFGFFGINMGFSLQSSQMSRIFQSIGANPNTLGFFFIFPPLMGMIVQPLIGKYSDRTWNRFGRRMPYLLFGAPNRCTGTADAAILWFTGLWLWFTGRNGLRYIRDAQHR